MTEDDAKKRVTAIENLQNDLDRRIASVDLNLYAQLAASAETILADPKTLSKLLTKFNRTDYLPALQQFGVDILLINDLNASYFEGAIGEELGGELVSQELFNTVKADVEALTVEQFGISASGEVIPGGLFDLFSQDTTVQRQIQQFAYGQKSSGLGLQRFKKNLKNFIIGDPDNPNAPNRGVYSRHYETVAFDAYQQADRVAQQSYAAGLQMTAFLYLGGQIPGTRPWCRVRDGKCFLRSEIEKFGTSADAYGGYENKAIGYFSGKPKGDYSPFINAGGWRCRHHYSAISDREALRRRDDLEKVEGVLRVKPQA